MATKTEVPNENLFATTSKQTQRETAVLVDKVVTLVKNVKAAEKLADAAKDELKELAAEAYFEFNFQSEAPLHTFDANGRSNILQFNFPNKYELNVERTAELYALLGDKSPLAKYFKRKTIANVDVTSLEKQNMVAFFKEMAALCKDYGLQGFADDKFEVDKEFHDARHELAPALNEAINGILPLQVAITV